MLRAESLHFNYDKPVVEDISLQIAPGELLSVIGPNGSGKSTLVRLLAGMLRPASGKVFVGDSLLESLTRKELARQIGYVAQETRVQFPMSALEFVLQGRFAHGRAIGFEGSEDLAAAREAMEMTDTASFMDRQLNALSGGERQRVFLARALAQQPRIMLLDEPTSNLDIAHQVSTFLLLNRLTKERAVSVLFITHELNLAAEFADRILLIKEGKRVSCGTPHEVFQPEMLERVFETRLIVDKNPESGAPRVTVSVTKETGNAGRRTADGKK
jgi:iron complex transport system ATP-binding protein